MSASLFEKLATRLGPKGYATDAETLAPHLKEWRGKFQGRTPFMAMPQTTEEVADVVRACAEAGVAITPQGGNTGLVGGQIPHGEVLLSLSRMNRIRAIDAENDSLVAEAGVVLAAVQQAAAEANRLFPLSLASEGSATIGGLISTNAGGVHVVRYGMMRELVLGVEAVLPDGRVFAGLKGLRKDNTGYDLKQLFIGAEGTLGVVTAASLKLHPRPLAREVALAATASPRTALALLHRLKEMTGAVSAFEIMNRQGLDFAAKNFPQLRDPFPSAPFVVLAEFEGMSREALREIVEAALAAAIDSGQADDAIIAENTAQMRDFWALREQMSAGHKPEGPQVSHDISVPVSRTPDFIERAGVAIEKLLPGARIVAFGHMGDGNIHYTALAPAGAEARAFQAEPLTQAVHEIVADLGGAISAEHGIGRARAADLARFKDAASLQLMRAVKRALDPDNIMNPSVLLA